MKKKIPNRNEEREEPGEHRKGATMFLKTTEKITEGERVIS